MLGVMSRASLGHTGRPIKAAPATVLAYGLINGAAIVRVVALAVPSLDPLAMLLVSGVLWIGAFACFVYIYTPILTHARLDGQAG